jgi:DnaJ-class molecular chaperone
MTENLNPYEELGVTRDADEKAIRRAYRFAAGKSHPDVGGSAEAFARVTTSLAVLTDPAKRRTYDEAGRIEEDRPDNDRAAALQVVEKHVSDIVNAFLSSGMTDPALDPSKMDVIADVKRRIMTEIAQAEQGIAGGVMVVQTLKDLARRFKVKHADEPMTAEDPIGRGFKRQVEQNEQQLAMLRHGIEVHRMAIQIAEGYSFEMDSPYQRSPYGWERPGDRRYWEHSIGDPRREQFLREEDLRKAGLR